MRPGFINCNPVLKKSPKYPLYSSKSSKEIHVCLKMRSWIFFPIWHVTITHLNVCSTFDVTYAYEVHMKAVLAVTTSIHNDFFFTFIIFTMFEFRPITFILHFRCYSDDKMSDKNNFYFDLITKIFFFSSFEHYQNVSRKWKCLPNTSIRCIFLSFFHILFSYLLKTYFGRSSSLAFNSWYWIPIN